jgi:hypothetical protein
MPAEVNNSLANTDGKGWISPEPLQLKQALVVKRSRVDAAGGSAPKLRRFEDVTREDNPITAGSVKAMQQDTAPTRPTSVSRTRKEIVVSDVTDASVYAVPPQAVASTAPNQPTLTPRTTTEDVVALSVT